MIIFNLHAVVVAVLCAIVLGPLYWLAKGFMSGPYGELLAGVVITLISAVCEVAGLKARVFWLPTWLLGLGATGYQLYELFGGVGIGIMVGIAVLLLVGLVLLGWQAEKKEWAAAPSELAAAQEHLARQAWREAWTALGKAFFVPGIVSATAEMCAHGARVMELYRWAMSGRLSPEEQASLDRVETAFRAGVQAPDKLSVDSKDETALREAIQRQIEALGPEPAAA